MGKDPLRLVQDVETRWNSEYLMLSRLLDLKEALPVELARSSNSIDGLSFDGKLERLSSDAPCFSM